MRVILTGSSGFIGHTLREQFSARTNWEVIGVDRVRPREIFEGDQEHVMCDLLDARQLESVFRWYQPDVVVHTAAQARVDPSLKDPMATYKLNVQASMNLMEACQAVGVKQLVAASSEAIYGKARAYPCPENNDFAPANPYAASKVAMDVLVQQFDRVLPTCVVRSGMGWGPRSNPREQVVAKFITKCLKDEALKFPPRPIADPTRDLNHVEDFSRGIIRIIEERARGVFNLSGGVEYDVHRIAELVIAGCGQGRIEYDAGYAYREGELGFRTWLDVGKAERELGHKPENHLANPDGTPSAALKDTIDWYEDHLDGSYWA